MMEWKSFGTGFVTAILLIASVGSALSVIITSGQTHTAPTGMWSICYNIQNTDATRIQNAVKENAHKPNVNLTESGIIFSNYGKTCLQNYVINAENRISRRTTSNITG